MWLVVGLGNPGAEYAATRHNIGFVAIDRLAQRVSGGTNFSKKFHGEVSQINLDGENILLLKPQTFMNLSGKSVQAAMAFYKVPPQQLIVLHDEIDLPLGKLRIKQGGGANGHNGIKDIDQMVGPDYWRIRLGVGRATDGRDTADYVLSRFAPDEQPLLDKTLAAVTEHMASFWNHSPEKLASKVAETLNPPLVKKPATDAPVQDKDGTN